VVDVDDCRLRKESFAGDVAFPDILAETIDAIAFIEIGIDAAKLGPEANFGSGGSFFFDHEVGAGMAVDMHPGMFFAGVVKETQIVILNRGFAKEIGGVPVFGLIGERFGAH
jgi:hypothetical protein